MALMSLGPFFILPTFAVLLVMTLMAFTSAHAEEPDSAQIEASEAKVKLAIDDFNAQKYDQALEQLNEALALTPQNVFALNLVGAVQTKKKEYDAARGSFSKALDLDPSFFPARYNLGELDFLQQNYPKALDYFTALRNNFPGNELIDFKIVLLHLKLDDLDRANRVANRMRFPGETPAWYFSKAAIDQATEKKRDARKYVSTAKQLYGESTQLFEESLEEAGLMP